MKEQYFFVRKLDLGKELVSLSLVVMEVSRAGYYYYYRVLTAICCQPVDGSLICFM